MIPNDIYHHQNDKQLYHLANRSMQNKVLTILPIEYKLIKSFIIPTRYSILIFLPNNDTV